MIPKKCCCLCLLLSLLSLISFGIGCNDEIKIESVTPRLLHAEVPHWDSHYGRLIFGDQSQTDRKVCIYDYESRNTTCTCVDEIVGPVVPIAGCEHRFLAGLGPYLVLLKWDGKSPKSKYIILRRVSPDKPKVVFNDGKADAKGRFWLGTVGTRDASGEPAPYEASLYHYSEEICTLETDVEIVSISNGIAWNSDSTKMYYIDSRSRGVDSYDYDITTGSISNQETVFDFKANRVDGLPDGMTIDANDNLWITCLKASQIIQVDPEEGLLLKIIKIPTSHPTSAAWGGPDLDILYVTTSQSELSERERAEQEWAGSVLAISGLKAKGRPPNSAVLCQSPNNNQTEYCD